MGEAEIEALRAKLAEAESLLELRTRQLADCTRTMREVAAELLEYDDQAYPLVSLSEKLMFVRAKAGAL